MIKNEDTYCIVQHKIVREIGACEAVVYGTIQGLLRKTDGYGGVSNQTIMDMCGMNRKSLSRYIDKLIQAGYIEKVSGDGRGNISIYYISKKGDKMTIFSEEKGGQNDPKRGTNLPIKGDKMTPINKGINKEINKESSSFEAEPQNPKMEDEDLKNINLFRDNSEYDNIPKEVKESFAEFWKMFTPDESQKCKYKVALLEWARMSDLYREACLKLLEKFGKPQEPNPYFYLQHFAPKFLNEREQYNYCKLPGEKRLCKVRWKDKQMVCTPFVAEVFQLPIIDNHYEKRFE